MSATADMKEAVFNLKCWQSGHNFFTCQLYELIGKADASNKAKLRRAFPVEVAAFEEWQAAKNEEEFFKRYEVM